MAILILIVLGLCFGSFINALVWRLHKQGAGEEHKTNSDGRYSILRGRSMCPSCGHELAVADLVPVFSWLALRGRCRYCQRPISIQYPAVELAAVVVFVSSYLFWPVTLAGSGQWLLFVTWLAAAVGLLALAVYDSRWMILPNRILYPTLIVALAGRLIYILHYSQTATHSLEQLGLSLVVASGVFLLLFVVSSGHWIGFGDVRLGLITGSLLATPARSFLMIFLASILGTLFVLPALASGKKNAASRLPFGPYLIAATWVAVLFGGSLINWYKLHLY